jgi:hypothetical protein
MKKLIIFIALAMFLTFDGNLSALTLSGKYLTITESDCDMELLLDEHGKGKAVQACRLEDGSHRDDTNETRVTWKQEDNKVIITSLKEEYVFIYKPEASCEEFGSNGYSAALVLETRGNHLFSGYNSSYWKVPGNCKLITEK